MRISRPDLAAAIDSLGCDPSRVRRLMLELEPIFMIAESGEYRLAERARLNRPNVAAAIAKATLAPVRGLVAISSSKDPIRADWRREREYETFVSLALRMNRRDAFDSRHGAEALGQLVEPLWDNLGMAFTAVLQRRHETFFDRLEASLAYDVAYGPMIAIAYAAGYVLHGADAEFEEMRGLVSLLPWVVPIGAPAGMRERWLVLVD